MRLCFRESVVLVMQVIGINKYSIVCRETTGTVRKQAAAQKHMKARWRPLCCGARTGSWRSQCHKKESRERNDLVTEETRVEHGRVARALRSLHCHRHPQSTLSNVKRKLQQ